jgi:hypothetical protein
MPCTGQLSRSLLSLGQSPAMSPTLGPTLTLDPPLPLTPPRANELSDCAQGLAVARLIFNRDRGEVS